MFSFLTGEELNREELISLLATSDRLKRDRKASSGLQGQTVALLFEKPSLRTRVSFTVAAQELGAQVIEIPASQRKQESPEETIRVLQGYVQALMLRTHQHSVLERMLAHARIPLINGLSDTHHPCQALADLLTLQQRYGRLDGLKLTYVGDGNNVLNSLLLLAPFLGMHLHYACPKGYEPNALILRRAQARATAGGGKIQAHHDPARAARGAHAIYTDVWTSMGFEEEAPEREKVFWPYQLNAALYSHCAPGALILHCMPMLCGREITEDMAEHSCSVIYQQSENRLHVQKALLLKMMLPELALTACANRAEAVC